MLNLFTKILKLSSDVIVCIEKSSQFLYMSQPAQQKLTDDPSVFQFLFDDFNRFYDKQVSQVIKQGIHYTVVAVNHSSIPVLLAMANNNSANNLTSSIYMQQLVDYSPGSLYWKDCEGRYLGCNRAMIKLSKVDSAQDIIGKTDAELWPDQALKLRQNDHHVVHSGETIQTEEAVKVGDDLMHFVGIKAPLRDSNDNIIGIVGNSLEITELKTIQLKLEKAKKIAESASKAKSEFIANISHDIRTPISGILGLAQSIKQHTEKQSIYDQAQLLIDSTQDLLVLLNETIDVASIGHGQMKQPIEDFDLFELVDHNVTLFQPALANKRLRIHTQISEQVPRYLHGNRSYLDRILLNLLGNAVKFTEVGGIDIRVEAKQSTAAGEIVVAMHISDTGIGIPKDKFDEIFKYFSRLTPSCKGTYKGNGLGLYTVQEYIKSMHGKITVDSEPGQGSCFTLTLPFKLGQSVKTRRIDVFGTSSSAKIEIPVPSAHKLNVLLVEDNLIAARSACGLLEKMHCQVVHADSGEQALQYAGLQPFDFVLMDIGLPDMSGLEATQQIHQQPGKANLPIIALTGHIAADKQNECLQAGMQQTIVKPLTYATLVDIIKQYQPQTKID